MFPFSFCPSICSRIWSLLMATGSTQKDTTTLNSFWTITSKEFSPPPRPWNFFPASQLLVQSSTATFMRMLGKLLVQSSTATFMRISTSSMRFCHFFTISVSTVPSFRAACPMMAMSPTTKSFLRRAQKCSTALRLLISMETTVSSMQSPAMLLPLELSADLIDPVLDALQLLADQRKLICQVAGLLPLRVAEDLGGSHEHRLQDGMELAHTLMLCHNHKRTLTSKSHAAHLYAAQNVVELTLQAACEDQGVQVLLDLQP
ncbi:hypothetical protein CRUP_028488, partial [Coryphaenoides rupestris]